MRADGESASRVRRAGGGRTGRVMAMLLSLLALALPPPAPASAATPAVQGGAAPPLTRGEVQQLIGTLNDPRRRADLVAALSALSQATPTTPPASAAPAPAASAGAAAVGKPVPAAPANPPKNGAAAKPTVGLAPNSLGGELIGELRLVRRIFASQVTAFGRMFSDSVLAMRWLHRMLSDPATAAALLGMLWRTAAVMLAGIAADYLLARLLRRPLLRLARETRRRHERRLAAAGPSAATTAPLSAAPATQAATTDAVATQAAIDDEEEDAADAAAVEAPTGDAAATAPTQADAEERARDAGHRARTLRFLRRVPFAILRLLLKLLPVALFLLVSNTGAELFADHPISQLMILTVINLYAIGRVACLLMDMLLAPRVPEIRLLGAHESTAQLVCRWWAWLVGVALLAAAVSQIGDLLDVPARAIQSMIRALALIEHLLLAVVIWQLREPVALALMPPRRLRATSLGGMFARFTRHWWLLGEFLNASLWVVLAAQLPGGYRRIWYLLFVTCAVLFVSRLVSVALLGLLDRAFRIHPDLERRFPGLERRASRYYPLLRRGLNVIVLLVSFVALLQAWGLPAVGWFVHGTLGTKLISALLSILVALLVGVLVWEIANATLERQIARYDSGSQMARAVRLRTLIPILRTGLFIALATVIGLTVLSEIGVNVAPLLAGAGIFGVALGFGSQKLVQDFITGIFLLAENTMQVGDTVTAAGMTGTVEHLSIRTLRLRGGDGAVQTIPFSSVTTVVNASRDFAVASVSISVSIEADPDQVTRLMGEIGQGLREDDSFGPMILDSFALNGVDGISEYALAISGTIRCTVAGRWPVQREFYRRLRAALQEQHVKLPARPLMLSGPAPLVPAPPDDEKEPGHG